MLEKFKKRKGWKAWVIFGVLMAGGAAVGINPAIMSPVAESISQAVESSLEGSE